MMIAFPHSDGMMCISRRHRKDSSAFLNFKRPTFVDVRLSPGQLVSSPTGVPVGVTSLDQEGLLFIKRGSADGERRKGRRDSKTVLEKPADF